MSDTNLHSSPSHLVSEYITRAIQCGKVILEDTNVFINLHVAAEICVSLCSLHVLWSLLTH